MAAETGHFALILALMLALSQVIVPLLLAENDNVVIFECARRAALAQFIFVAAALVLLFSTQPQSAKHYYVWLAALFGISGAGAVCAFLRRTRSPKVSQLLIIEGVLSALVLTLAPLDRASFERSAAPVSHGEQQARTLPEFSLPPLFEGHDGLTSEDFKGRLIVLNIFASWCPQCKSEHAKLLQIASSGVVLYGINWKESRDDGSKFLTANQNPYERTGSDASGALSDKLDITGVPETFVIDTNGQIRLHLEGPISDEVWTDTLAPVLASLKDERSEKLSDKGRP